MLCFKIQSFSCTPHKFIRRDAFSKESRGPSPKGSLWGRDLPKESFGPSGRIGMDKTDS